MDNARNWTASQTQTRAFLTFLEREAKTKAFHFRTFDDKKDRNRLDLLDDHEEALRSRNANGAGVFVVINEGGHKDYEIKRVRAVFADTDGAPFEPIVEALTPHLVISTSPGKWHVYWLVEEGFPLDRFASIQQAIAKKFGTDPKVRNLSRVMRLPGFAHNKQAPFDVHLHQWAVQLPRYNIEQIVDRLGLQEYEQTRVESVSTYAAKPRQLVDAFNSNFHRLSEVAEMLRFINPWSDRDQWMKIIFALAREFGEAGRELAVRWSRGELWLEPNP